MPALTPTPFEIFVSDETLNWIDSRVATSRISTGFTKHPADAWDLGLPHSTLAPIVEYWKTKYNWREIEARINSSLKQFTVPISHAGEDLTLHFVHHRSSSPTAIPLLFAHGWCGSFLEVQPIINLLTNPPNEEQAFHVVAPSIPGFSFSSPPSKPGFSFTKIAEVYHKLMSDVLGYKKYIGQGGDWGSIILRCLALARPEALVGLHLNMLVCKPPSVWKKPVALFSLATGWATKGEKEKMERSMWWWKEESGYQAIMGTKPMAIAPALLDSPVGQLAWLRDRMQPIVDGYVWTEEESITWAMMYILAANVANSSIYVEARNFLGPELLDAGPINKSVAVGFSAFPKDAGYTPRWWAEGVAAERFTFWRENGKGGHFASTEVPESLVMDVRDFVGTIGEKVRGQLRGEGEGN